jgi:hypothetical protein
VGLRVPDDLLAALVDDTGSGSALPVLAFTMARLTERVERGGELSLADYRRLGGSPGPAGPGRRRARRGRRRGRDGRAVRSRPGRRARAVRVAVDPGAPAARATLLDSYVALQSVQGVLPGLTGERPITGMAAARDGRTIALRLADGVVVVTDPLGPAPATWAVPGLDEGANAQLSPDGGWLVTGDDHGELRLWDVRARTGPVQLWAASAVPQRDATQLAFSADSAQLLAIPPPGGPGEAIARWDLRTASRLPVATDLLAPPADEVTDGEVRHAWFSDDPGLVVVEYAGRDPVAEQRHVLLTRSVTDAAVRQVLVRKGPGDTSIGTEERVVAGGALLATCDPGTVRGDPGRGVGRLLLRDTATGAERAPLPLLGSGPCAFDDYSQTADKQHLLEEGANSADSSAPATAQITSLSTGEAYEFTLHRTYPGLRTFLDVESSVLAVDDPARGAPTVLVSRGPDVLLIRPATRAWLAGTSPTGSVSTIRGGTGDTVVLNSPDGLLTVDTRTGAVLGRVPADPGRDRPTIGIVAGQLYALDTGGPDRRLRGYALPGLQPTVTIPLPGPPDPRPTDTASVRLVDGRVIALVGGRLSVRDLGTGAELAAPHPLGADAAEQASLRAAYFGVRPGHPDEIAVVVADRPVQLWSVSTGRPIRAMPGPAGVRDLIFDPSGERAAVVRDDRTVEEWDPATGQRVHGPHFAPTVLGLIGYTADGYLVTAAQDNAVQLWDLERGAPSGSVRLTRGQRVEPGPPSDPLQLGGEARMPAELPLSAERWAGELCRAVPGYSPAERGPLPVLESAPAPCP